MRKKTLALFSLMLAFVMALSLAVLAGCKKGNKTEKPKGDGTAVSLVSDETLKDKLLALYTFEDTDKTLKASDPFTGEAREANNGTYGDNYKLAVNPKANGGSTTVFDTSTAFSLGKFDETQIADEFEDYAVVEGNTYEGLSFSFWAYNTVTLEGKLDSLGESADWANLVTNGYESINWGNLSYMATGTGSYKAFYPTNGTVIGRGAYSEEAYAAAREIYGTDNLTSFKGKGEYFAVWNAISGNTQGEGSDDNEYVAAVAASYLQTWRYITINIDLEEGLSFYNNGRLAFTYKPKTFVIIEGGWEQIYADLVMGAMKEYEEDEMYLNFFNAESGIYVDDLIVGKSLTAADACNLYEDVSGKTWTEADLELTSALSDAEQEKETISKEYFDNLLAGVNTPVEGDLWGEDCKDGGNVIAGVEREDKNSDGKITDTVYDAREAFMDTYSETDYIEVIGSTDLTNAGLASFTSKNYFIPTVSEGKYKMTVSGIQLTDGAENWHSTVFNLFEGSTGVATARIDNFSWGIATGYALTATKMDLDWPDMSTDGIYLNVIQRFCKLDVILEYDGSALTVTYNIYYYFAGETFTLKTSDGTEFEYTVPKDGTTLYNSITYTFSTNNGLPLTLALDVNAMCLKFGNEYSAFLVQEVTGGTYSETAPVSEGVDQNAKDAANAAMNKIVAEREAALATAIGDSSLGTVGAEDLNNNYAVSSLTVTPSGETWSVSVSGYLKSGASGNHMTPGVAIYLGADDFVGVIRADRYVNGGTGASKLDSAADGGNGKVTWETKINGVTAAEVTNDNWADWTGIIAYSKFDMTMSYDGSKLTVVFTVEAVDKGETYVEEVSYTDKNGADQSFTLTQQAPQNAWTTTATIADSTILSKIGQVYFGFSGDHCYYTLTNVTGGTLSGAAQG